MRAPSTEANVETLLRRAEQAIRASRPREQIERLLEQILGLAADGSDAARFAHRHLAELSLEQNPWGAALHLRKVLHNDSDDDIAHALMGLCQALQGNFRMAVSAYRRAVALSPANPWYNHNLGHLLDVALGLPHEAVIYLRRANRSQPLQEEVGASLVHCLGRIGAAEEGLTIARALAEKHPRHRDLKLLVGWLEEGAPPRPGARAAMLHPPASRPSISPRALVEPAASLASLSSASRSSGAVAPRRQTPASKAFADVEGYLKSVMPRFGWSESSVQRAVRMWRDALTRLGSDWSEKNGSAMAAAVEYALARIDGVPVTQRDVAARYDASLGQLATRYSTLRAALSLTAHDARYAPTLD